MGGGMTTSTVGTIWEQWSAYQRITNSSHARHSILLVSKTESRALHHLFDVASNFPNNFHCMNISAIQNETLQGKFRPSNPIYLCCRRTNNKKNEYCLIPSDRKRRTTHYMYDTHTHTHPCELCDTEKSYRLARVINRSAEGLRARHCTSLTPFVRWLNELQLVVALQSAECTSRD